MFLRRPLALLPLLLTAACSDTQDTQLVGSKYALTSVVIDANNERFTYIQGADALEGHFTNEYAIEVPGNAVTMSGAGHLFVGLAEEPTWVRYSITESGTIEESGRLSLLNLGATSIDFGNAFVDETTAVSVLSQQAIAVVWNPSTMTITGEVDLSHLLHPDYPVEVWTTVAHEGLVYIPGRWTNWDEGTMRQLVSLTIVDPKARVVVGVAEDDRCSNGGQVSFDAEGYGYVMSDGRTNAAQMFARVKGESVPQNCLLRIPPGGTDFEDDYFYSVPALTGGLQVIGEMGTGAQGSGFAFNKMFYEDRLPDGVEAVDFAYWNEPAHRMWRFTLADPPVAEVVEGAPFSAIGFTGSALEGLVYLGESLDMGATSDVYEYDGESNAATVRFTMDGYFNGVHALGAP